MYTRRAREELNARPDRDSHASVNSLLIPDLKKEKSKRKKSLVSSISKTLSSTHFLVYCHLCDRHTY